MWNVFSIEERSEYKKMILAFASLTELFSQKNGDLINKAPIINSKFQETVFQKAFDACAEDISNTSFDVSIDKGSIKYLVGIKTFLLTSGDQKIAQFKANHDDWSGLIEKIRANSFSSDGIRRTKEEVNFANKYLYQDLAQKISHIRNQRIDSSLAKVKGFKQSNNNTIEMVYHVLMPSCENGKPKIIVGEVPYERIDEQNIQVIGCTDNKYPTNFSFTDGKHFYKYTSADSQLLMNFQNRDIEVDQWDVKYSEDAYSILSGICTTLYDDNELIAASNKNENEKHISESVSWLIENQFGEVERFSGFNGFYGLGSRIQRSKREARVHAFVNRFHNSIEPAKMEFISSRLSSLLLDECSSDEERERKLEKRKEVVRYAEILNDEDLFEELAKLVFRPKNEMYIPIPKSRLFHEGHPFFFGGEVRFDGQGRILTEKEDRSFNLVFEPSKDCIRAFIAEDWGKAIESKESMGVLGEWILRGVFQLKPYEPLTRTKLEEIGINAIRLYKLADQSDVHIEFFYIDKENLPSDYWK